MPVRIVTDSTADLSPEQVGEQNITVVPVYVRFGEKSYRDGVDITLDQFYHQLVESPVHPSTSQPTPADFARVYRAVAKESDQIVSIHVSSKLSGTYNSALQGKEIAATRGCDIRIIDSQSVTMGLGMMTMLAARLAAAGESLQKITDEVKLAIDNTHLMGTFDTLKYLLLGGRIGKAKALLGNVLSVKPVLTVRNGELLPVGNVRTRSRGAERLFEFARSAFGIQELAVIYSTTPDEAIGLKERCASIVDKGRLHVTRLGPALGVHSGPGMLAVAFRKMPVVVSNNEDKGETKSLSDKLSAMKVAVPSLHLPRLNLPHRQVR